MNKYVIYYKQPKKTKLILSLAISMPRLDERPKKLENTVLDIEMTIEWQ